MILAGVKRLLQAIMQIYYSYDIFCETWKTIEFKNSAKLRNSEKLNFKLENSPKQQENRPPVQRKLDLWRNNLAFWDGNTPLASGNNFR